MTTELRKTGISVLGDVPWGTHLCHFYQTKEDLLDILIPYFKTGLDSSEFCMWVVADPLDEDEAREALRLAVPEAEQHLETGRIEIVPHTYFLQPSRQETSPSNQLEIVPHTDWYLKGGAFVAERVMSGWNEKLAEALAKGYAGMRANGNESWLTKDNWKDFSRYEKALDETLSNHRMIVLCSYPLAGAGAAEIFDVVRTHQFAMARRQGEWEVIESPELIQAKAEIKRLNEELEQRVVERTRQLAKAVEELKSEIAERKQAEDALRRSEDRLRLVIDAIPTMAWSIQPDGDIDFVNQRWVEYTGLSLEEEIEQPNAAVHPEDLPRVWEEWKAHMAAEKQYDAEMRLRRADGEYRWFLVRTAPLRDDQGNLNNWYGVAIDIEDRKQAEEKLKQSESQLAEGQRLAHVGSWNWDFRSNAVNLSDELYRIFGLQAGTIKVAADAMPFIHPEDRDLALSAVDSSIRSKKPYSFYYRVVRPDGDERTVHSRGFIVSDDNGDPIGLVGATQDVTELKRTEEKLKATSEQLRALSERLRKAKEEEGLRIARELHDELGSALTGLKWGLLGIDKVKSKTSKADSNAREKIAEMVGLVDSTINTVRRISSELRPGVVDDLGLVSAIEWHAQQFEHNTGIVCHFESNAEYVDLTREQATTVFRIFQETMTNIQRHALATKVNILLEEEDGKFVLEVRDNGRGITEDEKLGRRSLGLLGMRERAHSFGGTVEISGAPGKGTVLTVRLPKHTNLDSKARTESIEATQTATNSRSGEENS